MGSVFSSVSQEKVGSFVTLRTIFQVSLSLFDSSQASAWRAHGKPRETLACLLKTRHTRYHNPKP
jgi:hypothetical protein